MKHYKLLVMLLLVGSSCSKPDDSDSVASQIQGKWEWKKSIGGMDGVTVHNPETAEHTRQLILSGGRAVLTINEEDTVENTTYKIQKEKSILNAEFYDVLTIYFNVELGEENKIRPMRYVIREINGSSLQLDEDVYDGFGHIYFKK